MNSTDREIQKRKWLLMVASMCLVGLLFFAAGCASQPEHRSTANEKGTTVETTPHAASAHSSHWDYHGEAGPESWSKLSDEFKLCQAGSLQSPVDLRWSKPNKARKIEFHYQAAPLKMIDNGHTIQANFAPGSWALIEGHRYELAQMHFHSQSEHTIAGKSFPLEAHFVHKDAEGKLAVVGVFLKVGAKNADVDTLWGHLPTEKNKEFTHADVKFNPISMIPNVTTHYNYVGSLTTPPCSEGVNWNVMNTPIIVSQEQVEAFRKLYADNYRPVQPLKGRRPANY